MLFGFKTLLELNEMKKKEFDPKSCVCPLKLCLYWSKRLWGSNFNGKVNGKLAFAFGFHTCFKISAMVRMARVRAIETASRDFSLPGDQT